MALKVELVLTVSKQENEPKKKIKNSVEIKIQKVKKFQNFKINKKNKIWFAKDCKSVRMKVPEKKILKALLL